MGKRLQILLASLLGIPIAAMSVLAAPLGTDRIRSVIQRVVDIFGAFFSVDISTNIWVVKGLFFLLFFAIYNWAGRKSIWSDKANESVNSSLNKRTANIVALVLALITVYFIPERLITDMASMWAALMYLLLILVPFGIAFWYSFLNGSAEEKSKRSAGEHFLGALAFLIVLGLAMFFADRIGNNTSSFSEIAQLILDGIIIASAVGLLVKLLQAFFAIGKGAVGAMGGGEPWADKFERWGKTGDAWNKFRKGRAERAREKRDFLREKDPGVVSDVNFSLAGPGSVKVTWKLNDNEPKTAEIERYEIQVKTGRSWYNPSRYVGKWRNLSPDHVNGATNTVTYNGLDTTATMQFRVRAVNRLNNKGNWGYSREGAPSPTPTPTPHSFAPQLRNIRDAVREADGHLDALRIMFSRPPASGGLGILRPTTRPTVDIINVFDARPGTGQPGALVPVLRILAEANTALNRARAEIDAIRNDATNFPNISVAEYTDLADFSHDYQESLLEMLRLQTVSQHAILT